MILAIEFFILFSPAILFFTLLAKRFMLWYCPRGYELSRDMRWTAPAMVGMSMSFVLYCLSVTTMSDYHASFGGGTLALLLFLAIADIMLALRRWIEIAMEEY